MRSQSPSRPYTLTCCPFCKVATIAEFVVGLLRTRAAVLVRRLSGVVSSSRRISVSGTNSRLAGGGLVTGAGFGRIVFSILDGEGTGSGSLFPNSHHPIANATRAQPGFPRTPMSPTPGDKKAGALKSVEPILEPSNDLQLQVRLATKELRATSCMNIRGDLMKKLLPLVALAALTGCATPPSNIKAAPSDGKQCTQADRDRLADITSRQQRTANKDAFGVFMIGVPLGGDETHEPEIARLKGRCGVR